MARPKNASGPRTRQAILDAALDLFGDRGFFGTSLRDVASAVGVRESAIYNYFPSKQALFEALIAADQDERRERLEAALDEPAGDLHEVLERLARRSLEDFARPQQRQLFRILMSDGLRLARAGRLSLVDRMGSSHARLRDAMQRFIARGCLRPADPDMLAISFTAPLLVWRHLLAIDADLPLVREPDAFVRQHVDTFLRGAGQPADRLTTSTRARAPRRRPAPSSRRLASRPRP